MANKKRCLIKLRFLCFIFCLVPFRSWFRLSETAGLFSSPVQWPTCSSKHRVLQPQPWRRLCLTLKTLQEGFVWAAGWWDVSRTWKIHFTKNWNNFQKQLGKTETQTDVRIYSQSNQSFILKERAAIRCMFVVWGADQLLQIIISGV